VLLAHHAGVEEGEAGDVHHQRQRRGDQQPGGVTSVDDGFVGAYDRRAHKPTIGAPAIRVAARFAFSRMASPKNLFLRSPM
jgi:hypothetical protein